MNIRTKIFEKLYKFFQWIFYKWRFGKYGKNTVFWYPDRIINPQNIYIGDNCYFMHHARIETVINKKQGLCGKLFIGDGTSIEERCHFIAANNVEIGNDCVISADVFISDCNHGYKREMPIMLQPLEVKNTKIGNRCFIGIGARIMPGVELGDYCVVGANAVVTHSFPEGSIIVGVPGKSIGIND